MSAPDFVAIGHVTLDRFGDEVRPGGAAFYSAVTAHRLGLSVGILTSHAADFPLDAIPSRIEVVSLESPATTVFEYEATTSDLVVAPTLTAEDMHAGELSAFVAPLLPAATVVAMPTDRRLSMMAFSGSESQAEVNRPPPRLRFAEAKGRLARRL